MEKHPFLVGKKHTFLAKTYVFSKKTELHSRRGLIISLIDLGIVI